HPPPGAPGGTRAGLPGMGRCGPRAFLVTGLLRFGVGDTILIVWSVTRFARRQGVRLPLADDHGPERQTHLAHLAAAPPRPRGGGVAPAPAPVRASGDALVRLPRLAGTGRRRRLPGGLPGGLGGPRRLPPRTARRQLPRLAARHHP